IAVPNCFFGVDSRVYSIGRLSLRSRQPLNASLAFLSFVVELPSKKIESAQENCACISSARLIQAPQIANVPNERLRSRLDGRGEGEEPGRTGVSSGGPGSCRLADYYPWADPGICQ